MAETTTQPGSTITVTHPEHSVEFSLASGGDSLVNLVLKREDESVQNVQLQVEANGKVIVRIDQEWNLEGLLV